MDDQRRGLDGWHDGTDVDLEGHPHERNGIVRARGFDLEAAGELAEALVAGTAPRAVGDFEAPSPAPRPPPLPHPPLPPPPHPPPPPPPLLPPPHPPPPAPLPPPPPPHFLLPPPP